MARIVQQSGSCFAIALASMLVGAPLWVHGAEEEELIDPAVMAAQIDRRIEARLTAASFRPAPAADDAEFFRRAHLDLLGVTPTVAEVREFLAAAHPDKRQALIDQLVERPGHASHLAAVWREVLLPADPDMPRLGSRTGFEFWLRDRFARNIRYDNVVAELLTTQGDPNRATPALFFTAAELKPEELATRTARIFLGVQIDCAQCHDHPHDKWTKRDFWSFAAFFAQLEPLAQQRMTGGFMDNETGEVGLPGREAKLAPLYLGRQAAMAGGTRRQQLALWLASRDNPYFAKATVNRIWAHLFGRGLVEPRDDLGAHNAASHPELLDDLARYFVRTRFDVRLLIRTLARTATYQRTSAWPSDQPEPPVELYARMPLKSLTPEQLYDCLARAVRKNRPSLVREGEFQVDGERQAFLSKFEGVRGATAELVSGIPQALTLMNGDEIRAATDLASSGILAALEAPFFTDAERVETLFLATLSRPPSTNEQDKFMGYVDRAGTSDQRRRALGDVLWALLNSAEFTLNH